MTNENDNVSFDYDDLFDFPYKSKNDFLFDDLELLGDHMYTIAIREDTPVELKRYLLTAIKAYSIGTSLNHMLKKHSNNWDFTKDTPDKFYHLNNLIIKTVGILYKRIISKRLALSNLPDIVGLYIAGAALVRLETSFKSACFLLKSGYHFDGMAIVKLIFEQTSWAYSIFEIKDNSFFKIQPAKTISTLKPFIKWAGKLYGIINDEAHISTKEIYKIPNLEEYGKSIYLNNFKFSIKSSLILLRVLDCFGIVMEYIYKDYFTSFEYLNNDFTINEKRPSFKMIKKFENKCKIILDTTQKYEV